MDGNAPVTICTSYFKANEKFDGFNFHCLAKNCQKR